MSNYVTVTIKTLSQLKKEGIISTAQNFVFTRLETAGGLLTINGGETVSVSKSIADNIKTYIDKYHDNKDMDLNTKQEHIKELKAELDAVVKEKQALVAEVEKWKAIATKAELENKKLTEEMQEVTKEKQALVAEVESQKQSKQK